MNEHFLSDEMLKVLRAKHRDHSDDQFAEFVHSINRFQLDPFGNQIYSILRPVRKGSKEMKRSNQTGIDGYRLIADRTGAYAGNDDPVFDSEGKPQRATVTVHKLVGGQRCQFTATARWSEYFPGEQAGFMWKTKPHIMLGKCAEALALRKAFPAELSGLYTHEEMEQAASVAPLENAPNGNDAAPPTNPPKGNDTTEAKEKLAEAIERMKHLTDFPGLLKAYAWLYATYSGADRTAAMLSLRARTLAVFAERLEKAGDVQSLDELEADVTGDCSCLFTVESHRQVIEAVQQEKATLQQTAQA